MSNQNQPKKFYRARLEAESEGLCVVYDAYLSIRESDCYHFCVRELKCRNWEVPSWIEAKTTGVKIKKIAKGCSRFAFDSIQKALDNLRYRKRLQIQHLKRELAFAEKFIEAETFTTSGWIEGSEDLVNDYLRFD